MRSELDKGKMITSIGVFKASGAPRQSRWPARDSRRSSCSRRSRSRQCRSGARSPTKRCPSCAARSARTRKNVAAAVVAAAASGPPECPRRRARKGSGRDSSSSTRAGRRRRRWRRSRAPPGRRRRRSRRRACGCPCRPACGKSACRSNWTRESARRSN